MTRYFTNNFAIYSLDDRVIEIMEFSDIDNKCHARIDAIKKRIKNGHMPLRNTSDITI